MQDILVQAQFLAPAPAEVQSTPKQEETARETSFDDVLEARLEDRERKKTRSKEAPEPEQLAATVQNQQTAPPIQKQKAPEPESAIQAEPVQIPTVSTGQKTMGLPEALTETTMSESAAAAFFSGEIPEQPVVESVQETATGFEEMLAESQSAEADRSSEKDIIPTQSETLQAITEEKGKPLSEDFDNQKNSIEQTEEKNLRVQPQKTGENSTIPEPEPEPTANEIRAAVEDSNRYQEDSSDTDIQPDLEKTNETNTQVKSSQNEVRVQFQEGAPPAQVSVVSEPARTAEAQPAVILPQIEDGITQLMKSRKTSIRIQLQPEDLGRIRIKLVQDNNGLRVAMSAEQQDTNQLLERHLHTLQKSLSDAGIQLTGFDIGSRNQHNPSQTSDSWQTFTTRKPEYVSAPSVPELIQTPIQYSIDSAVDYRI
ncbi:MAG: flagellar hook-length control protein FliK [Anaerolineales bacterium]|nr:flagellar hook-length control protein FliK [Anaerolineales bacterium]